MNRISKAVRRRTAVTVTLAAVVAGAFGPAALALASQTVTLSATNQNRWVLTGAGFNPGKSDITVVVANYDSLAVIESQNRISTTPPLCSRLCFPGGAFAARGAIVNTTLLGPLPAHPLECANRYIAYAAEPGIGFIFSPVLTTPACPRFQ
jgi:hypothetical protein